MQSWDEKYSFLTIYTVDLLKNKIEKLLNGAVMTVDF